MRLCLYSWVLLLACPIRYWPLQAGTDETWRFALNYAHANGIEMGRDIVYTCGPLAYLIFPEHIGNNLEQGLIFQVILWFALAIIFADVFFRSGIAVRNLAMFSFFFALAAPLFWFSVLGPENLILAAALILLMMFHSYGSLFRYWTALILVGLLPLFKLSAVLIGAVAIFGLLVERIVERRRNIIAECACAVIIPVFTFTTIFFALLPSSSALWRFLRGTGDVITGYSTAMSLSGPHLQFLFAAESMVILAGFIALQAFASPHLARSHALLLIGPLLVSFKHGFVRQDIHVVNMFCFVALAMALASLKASFAGRNWQRAAVLAGFFLIIWQAIIPEFGSDALAKATGVKSGAMLLGALNLSQLKQRLDASYAKYPESARLEPEIVNLVGNAPVASLSVGFTNVAAAGLHLTLYPTVQRDAAYSSYLDNWNGNWVRTQGPPFLIFDGDSIDQRDPWSETPAMWMEIYRWYDARFKGPRNLLLQRRQTPRFARLKSIGHLTLSRIDTLNIPDSRELVFWTMRCGYSSLGLIQKALFRVPAVWLIVDDGGTTRTRRVSPEVMTAPSLANYLPSTLDDFYRLLGPFEIPDHSIRQLRLEGPGRIAYSSMCYVDLFRPSP